MATTKTHLHAALFLLKPKGNFVFELFQLNEKMEKPFNTHIFPPQGHDCISTIFFFFEKTK